MGKKYEDRWNEMKGMAIEHLKSCSGSDPKVLRTVVLDHDRISGAHFHFVAGMEEVEVSGPKRIVRDLARAHGGSKLSM